MARHILTYAFDLPKGIIIGVVMSHPSSSETMPSTLDNNGVKIVRLSQEAVKRGEKKKKEKKDNRGLDTSDSFPVTQQEVMGAEVWRRETDGSGSGSGSGRGRRRRRRRVY